MHGKAGQSGQAAPAKECQGTDASVLASGGSKPGAKRKRDSSPKGGADSKGKEAEEAPTAYVDGMASQAARDRFYNWVAKETGSEVAIDIEPVAEAAKARVEAGTAYCCLVKTAACKDKPNHSYGMVYNSNICHTADDLFRPGAFFHKECARVHKEEKAAKAKAEADAKAKAAKEAEEAKAKEDEANAKQAEEAKAKEAEEAKAKKAEEAKAKEAEKAAAGPPIAKGAGSFQRASVGRVASQAKGGSKPGAKRPRERERDSSPEGGGARKQPSDRRSVSTLPPKAGFKLMLKQFSKENK